MEGMIVASGTQLNPSFSNAFIAFEPLQFHQ